MNKIIAILLVLTGMDDLRGQSPGDTGGVLKNQGNSKIIHCGNADFYYVTFDKTSSAQVDKTAFLNAILKQGKEKIEKAGFKCSQCDDPSVTGCDMTISVEYEDDLTITDQKEDGKTIFTLDAQDVLFKISCSLCQADIKKESADSEGKPGSTTFPQAVGDYHSVEQQTKCNESGYYKILVEGMIFTKGTVEEAFSALIDLIQKNHVHFGFGCKLCPDGTRRCELEVDYILRDQGRNTIFQEPPFIDSTKEGITIPTQSIIVKYDCIDCPTEKKNNSGSAADNDGDAIPDESPSDFSAARSVMDSISYPWSDISLTDVRMKPGYPFLIPDDKNFPWLPVISGVAGAGVATYFITRNTDQPQDCAFTATSQISPASCGLANGTVSVTVVPADQYTFLWSNGSTNSELQNVPAGDYTVSITRTGTTCSQVVMANITNVNFTFEETIITNDAHCGEQDGSATISISPPGSYTYSWTSGGTGTVESNLRAGGYGVTVSQGGTCTESYQVNIGELPPQFSIIINGTPASCGGSDGSATATINPPGTYSIMWSNGAIGPELTGVPAGEYTVTVFIAGTSCFKSATVAIDESDPDFTLILNTNPSSCGGSDGSANVTVDPQGEYNYTWSNGRSGAQISGLMSATYSVTVSIQGTTCSIVDSAMVNELPPTFDAHAFTTPSECGQATGTGTIVVNPPADYTYAWSNGSTGQQVMDLPAGTYSITVTLTGTHCSKIISAEVLEHLPTFDVTVTTTPSGCTDSSGTATISVVPVGEYTYAWSNGMSGSQVSGLHSGDYIVTITIAGTDCSRTITVSVGQTGGEFTATLTTDAASCGIPDGSASVMIEPPGEYTYLWSDQQTTSVAQQLITGNYSVVVTDMNGCSSSFTTTVGEDPAEYITIVNTTPGTCIGGGNITFTLAQPVPLGGTPLHLEIVGPEGTISLSLAPGTYLLSSFTNVNPGNYTITVYNESIGTNCIESVNVIVPDNTIPLDVVDDFYTTPGAVPLFENALSNDSGLNIQMTSISDIIGGEVVFNGDGSFTFAPDPGFTGDASFTYIVTDACGTIATGVVTIFVEEVVCDFTLDATIIPASCGLNDGNIFVEVVEPGSYAFFWDTGDTGPVLSNVFAGTYTVTVEELNLGCSLDFTISVPETPADNISDVEVIQPTCDEPGEITFEAFTSGMNQLIMTVDHPNGLDVFIIAEGTVFLSDYVSITPGQYTVNVTDEGSGPDCFETFTVNIISAPSIQLIAEFITPPSSPPAMDGVIFIATIVQGVLPYEVFLNGIPIFTAFQQNFAINEVGAGDYTVQVRDANGCLSNLLLVTVPLPDIILSFGAALVHFPYDEQNQETASTASTGSVQWSIGLLASLEYYVGNHAQELRIAYAGSNRKSIPDFNSGYIEMQYLSELKRIDWKKILLSLDGGIGVRTTLPGKAKTGLYSASPQFWSIQASAEYNLLGAVFLKSNLSLRGWADVEKPFIEFFVTVPFMNRIKKMNRFNN